jgi:hypothetical protein
MGVSQHYEFGSNGNIVPRNYTEDLVSKLQSSDMATIRKSYSLYSIFYAIASILAIFLYESVRNTWLSPSVQQIMAFGARFVYVYLPLIWVNRVFLRVAVFKTCAGFGCANP